MSDAPFRLYDHIDLRVRNLDAARRFYDPLMRALGLRTVPFSQDPNVCVYVRLREHTPYEAFTLSEHAEHGANQVRIAFAASTREDVERIAEAALQAGAANFEAPHLCPEYTATYYAAFFDDPDGNRLEIVAR